MQSEKEKLMKYFYLRLFTIFSVVLLTANIATAQENVLYFMRNLPHSVNNNPAIAPKCNFYIQIVPDTYFEVFNTGFKPKDLFKYVDDKDVYIFNIDGIYDKMKDNNYLGAAAKIGIIKFGFRAGQSYLHFSYNIKSNLGIRYPRNLLLIKNGNLLPNGSPLEIKGLGSDFLTYQEFSVGMSRDISGKLRVGAKLNYLIGIANYSVNKLDLTWAVDNDMYNYNISTDMDIRFGSPIDVEFLQNADGIIDSIAVNNLDEDEFDDEVTYKKLKPYIFGKNRGLGIDLGAIYQLTNKLELSASIIDLGRIKWKTYPISLTQKGTFSFNGVDLMEISKDDSAYTELLTDSVLAFIKPSISNAKYNSWLNTKVYVGASYAVTSKWLLGALYRQSYYNSHTYQSLTLSSTLNYFRSSSLALSYSFMNRSRNIGLGLANRIGPIQIYAIFEQISPAIWAINESKFSDKLIRQSNTFTAHFGLTWVTGCKKRIDYGLLE